MRKELLDAIGKGLAESGVYASDIGYMSEAVRRYVEPLLEAGREGMKVGSRNSPHLIVARCAFCGEGFIAGDEVLTRVDEDLYFCGADCFTKWARKEGEVYYTHLDNPFSERGE